MKLEQRIKRKADWTFRRLTSRYRVLPDFLIAGFPRCGTTSLFNYLIQHKCVLSPLAKEVGFFSSDYANGVEWYKSYFPTTFIKNYNDRARNCRTITGEATPMYVFHPKAPSRIKKIIPEVKIILLLRNPIDRALSHYNSIKKRGNETLSFEDAIHKEKQRLTGEYERMLREENYYSEKWHFWGYLSGGHYMELLKGWFDVFDREKILIIKSEDMYDKPSNVFKSTCSFLELPEIELTSFEQYNISEQFGKISEQTRDELREYFRPHNQNLYHFLGIDFNWN